MVVMDPKIKLQEAFEAAIREFVAYRREHGGILLPDRAIIDQAYEEATYATGVRERPLPTYKEIPIIGSALYKGFEPKT